MKNMWSKMLEIMLSLKNIDMKVYSALQKAGNRTKKNKVKKRIKDVTKK